MGQGQRGLDLVQLFHLGKPHQICKFLHSIKMNPSALPDVTSINFLTCFTVLVLFSKCALASNKTNTYNKVYIKPHVSSMKLRVFKFLPHQDSKCVGAEVPGVPWRETHITSGFFEGRNWGHWGPQSLQRWWWFCQGVQCRCHSRHSPCWSHLGFARLARRTASQLQEAFSRLAVSPPCRLQVQPHVLELNPECFHPFAFKFWCPVCSENCHRFNNWYYNAESYEVGSFSFQFSSKVGSCLCPGPWAQGGTCAHNSREDLALQWIWHGYWTTTWWSFWVQCGNVGWPFSWPLVSKISIWCWNGFCILEAPPHCFVS